MSDIAILGEAPGKIAVVTRQPDAESAIRQQLDCILASKVFIQSERLSRFLRFIVEQVLEGNEGYLKEYVVGAEVYDRKPPYHPSQDSIVRTEARRLRNKIKEYYETEGKEDPVYIYLRPGSYVPVFQHKAALCGIPVAASTNDAIAIAVLPFRDLSETPLSAGYARGIPEELAYILMRTTNCRVLSPSAAGTPAKAAAQVAFEGSVRLEGDQIRVTARIVDAAGFHLWAMRVDAQTGSDSMFTIEERIASALSVGLNVLLAAADPA